MDREFLTFYNRELALLEEQAREFAEEYPGVAKRLGGLVSGKDDPVIGGLLEGAAFLAARVQLKLKHEFSEFTANLLEQLVPNYLAPTPSAMLARVLPPYADPALRSGRTIRRGAYLDATYRQHDRNVACRYRLSSNITLWPFEIANAEYFTSPAPIQALGVAAGPEVTAGLRLSLQHRVAAKPEDEPPDAVAAKQPSMWFSGCRVSDLPVYLLGGESDAITLYEQIFAHRVGVYLRYLDEFGDPMVVELPIESVVQVGFEEEDALLPEDLRVFRGFDLLREYFLFRRKFLGFRLTQLAKVMPRLTARTVDVILTFNQVNAQLAGPVQPGMFALYTSPAVNLFEKTADRILLTSNKHEFHLVPDRSHYLDIEPHRVLDVHAHYAGGRDRRPVQPLYSAPDGAGGDTGLYYTIRRVPRKHTSEERRYGTRSNYTGTDVFISLVEPARLEDEAVTELSVRALCSNRHLTEHLPIGQSGADFRFLDDTSLDVVCASGPSPPREPIVKHIRSTTETAHTGAVAWRLINLLSLNHLGIVERGAGRSGQSLREALTLFADVTDRATEHQIRGIRGIDSRPVVRRIRQRAGMGAARGIEVTVTMEEKAFEGSGVFLLGAVLDRFFAEYSAMNHFTQTVIRTVERGEIMRWPARSGARRPL
ncbi:MAG TPA: type VI secretion system baseplate subunit TssF [Microvirga sp.]|jgi:type VI secretion system protein ImpG|nr:type VI secretion system baseplate subunit TssF [Microvirga sp.]